jgi:hypothetical protein
MMKEMLPSIGRKIKPVDDCLCGKPALPEKNGGLILVFGRGICYIHSGSDGRVFARLKPVGRVDR